MKDQSKPNQNKGPNFKKTNTCRKKWEFPSPKPSEKWENIQKPGKNPGFEKFSAALLQIN